ncbi:MAG: hypothetical protein IT318_01045 [Anaerolineales bacterium]|nr:hypothetical protein [Anaerolineales bacterium]
MRRSDRLVVGLFAATALISLIVVPVAAQMGGGYDLGWNSFDGGGGTSSGGGYSLSGAIGQPDTHLAAGGAYALFGGYWGPLTEAGGPSIFLPFVRR